MFTALQIPFSVQSTLVQSSSFLVAHTFSVQNVFVSYVGIFLGGDYVFDPLNFTGLNIR